jgi:hypothetical protein
MSVLAFTVTLQDSQGNTVSGTGSATNTAPDVITIGTMTVVPDPAAAGTMRTLTVPYTTSLGLPVTGSITSTPSVVFTAVADPPAGSLQWTFVW